MTEFLTNHPVLVIIIAALLIVVVALNSSSSKYDRDPQWRQIKDEEQIDEDLRNLKDHDDK